MFALDHTSAQQHPQTCMMMITMSLLRMLNYVLSSVDCRQTSGLQHDQQACRAAVAAAASTPAAKQPLLTDALLRVSEQASNMGAASNVQSTAGAQANPHQSQAMQLLLWATAAAPALSASGPAATQLAMCALAVSVALI